MKTRFQWAPKRHILLGVELVLLLMFLVLRGNQAAMTWLVDHVTQPFKQGLSAVTYLVPIPLAELLYIGIGLVILGALICLPFALRRSAERRRTLYLRLLSLLCFVLAMGEWFGLAWGINYYADGFQERSGLYAQPVTVEELERVTTLFTEALNDLADQIPRDEDGLFAVSREEIFAGSTTVYDNLSQEFPFLARKDRAPKRDPLSKLLSAMGFLLGLYGSICVLLYAQLAALVCAVILLVSRKATWKDTLPFAPFFTAGFLLCLILGTY